MYDTMRTAAGAAPPTAAAPSTGPQGLRSLAQALRQQQLHASEPPAHTGISPLVWKMSSPQHRASLLRQHHLGSVFKHRKGWFSKLHAAMPGAASSPSASGGQDAPAAGLWRHHGLFRAAHHSGLLGHHAHGGWLRKLSSAVHAGAVQSPATAAPTAPTAAAAAAPAAPAASSASTPLAHGAQNAAEAASLANITQQFQSRFASSAKDTAAFAALLKQAFGDHYDAAKAEGIRQQTLAGDFSWMPKVQLASASQLKDTSGAQGEGVAMGCYSAGDDTIYLNRDLLASDPAQAEKILAEEMGHALDARLNTSDAAGDEGDIFSKLVHGETLSAGQLAEMKADNDHGVIEINGKKTEVEYGWFKKLRKAISGGLKKIVKAVTHGIKDGLKAAMTVAQGLATMNFQQVQQGLQAGVDAVKDTAKEVKKAVKETAKAIEKITRETFQKLLQSKLFNAILMVAHFIPAINLVVLAIDAAKAAYMVYQGVKYKSLSMVLAGVASLATAAAGISTNLGATGMATTLNKVASWAGDASKAYNAIAKKDLGSALGLIAGQTDGMVQQIAKGAQGLNSVVQAAKSGDTLAAVGAGINLAASDSKTGLLHDAGQVVQSAQALKALHEGRYDAAQDLTSNLDLAKEAQAQSNADAAQARAQAALAAAQGSEGSASGADEEGSQPPADPKAKLREMEQGYRQDTDEGASSVSVRQDDRGLYGTALRAAGGNAQDALVLLGLWKQDGLTLNDNGSPITKEGDKLRTTDVSQLSAEQRQALQREGAQVLRTNSVTMERNREAQAQARADAQAARQPAPNAGDPAWSFKEASQAQRKADDAREAVAAGAQHPDSQNVPSMTATVGDGLSPAQRFLLQNESLYQSPIGAGLYGVAVLAGADESTARALGAAGAAAEAIAGAATLGGARQGDAIQPAGSRKSDTRVDSYINLGKQERHLLNSTKYQGGGYFNDASQAQDVLQAYQRGEARVVGRGSDGGSLVVSEKVTGVHVNERMQVSQETNVFWIKGSSSVSVVPVDPRRGGNEH